ncbi:hypothetical protein DPEC_G00248010 [Dallia pectoralis]|uniref:Uncharacterized protein n=1 Tax=Dallia pectoralis TaxID=75939 RepID=A0ACC2FWF3_DALPE|nr:hypothetical protein DPEC_G00248010 [Dallia pectoralis]
MGLLLTVLGLLLCSSISSSQRLNPSGRNVCQDLRDPFTLVCCTGWRQQAVCEGERACQQDEVCVYPNFCRCRHGYFGAHCQTRCPPMFWAPDCTERCECHPHGRCDSVTGKCTCHPNRWGPLCQNACQCGPHSHCNSSNGTCTCDEGWWSPTCAKQCQCYPGTSTCDPLTGRCHCSPEYWGLMCNRRCNCNLLHSQCDPAIGVCVCHPGYKGLLCNKPCGPGEHGSSCRLSCGHCKGDQPCSALDGGCVVCEPGWNGKRCDRQCPQGYHGDHCQETCPLCRNSEPCDPRTGACLRCEAGWTGPRCDEPCSNRTFGDGCRFLCSPCFLGHCDHVTGSCVCKPGYQGESCNSTCPDLLYGFNCTSVCDCGEGVTCHPATGDCPYSGHRALIAGLLFPFLLAVLCLLCCCCCCGGGPTDVKDRVPVGDGETSVRVKHHMYNVMANVSSAVPCFSAWSSGLPRVTVSHHDPELTFNHSFIEPPSSGWVTDGSFDSDEETGEPLYCVPPREDIPAVAGGELQEFQHEMTSKCNIFPDPSDPSAFSVSGEDLSSPFGIPRTSSMAKAKRPSVSFAEGTRFNPKERHGSNQDLTPGPPRTKPKSPWGVLALSALQAQGKTLEVEVAAETVGEADQGGSGPGSSNEAGDPDLDRYTATPSRGVSSLQGAAGGRRRTQTTDSSTDAQLEELNVGMDKVTTVYVTVGKAGVGRPMSKLEPPTSSGPVQAMLRRLGSLQRHKDQEGGSKQKGKGLVAEAITKPPRRKLGSRASVWEQGSLVLGRQVGEGVAMRKPSRRKQHSSHSSPADMGNPDAGTDTHAPLDGTPAASTARRPLSSILRSVPEVDGLELRGERSEVRDEDGKPRMQTETEAGYLMVGPAGVKGVVTSVDDEPNLYENVHVMHS